MRPHIKTILFAADLGNDIGYIFDYALSLAQQYGARIHIVHGHEALNVTAQSMAELYMFQDGMDEAFEKSLQETEVHIQQHLEQLCQRHLEQMGADKELVADIHIMRKPPKMAILDAAADLQADLIVMGSHRHSALTDALLGSTTMKVLHSANVPVFVVRIPH